MLSGPEAKELYHLAMNFWEESEYTGAAWPLSLVEPIWERFLEGPIPAIVKHGSETGSKEARLFTTALLSSVMHLTNSEYSHSAALQLPWQTKLFLINHANSLMPENYLQKILDEYVSRMEADPNFGAHILIDHVARVEKIRNK